MRIKREQVRRKEGLEGKRGYSRGGLGGDGGAEGVEVGLEAVGRLFLN